MTRTAHLKSATPDSRRKPASPPPRAEMPPFGAAQMQHVWTVQACMLEETRTFCEAWFGRRHSMAQAMGELGTEIMQGGGDSARMVAAFSAWQDGAGERLRADMQDWLTLCTNCTGHLAREANDAETELIDSTVEIARRAGTVRHAIPV
ncbi:hypothetical protein [Limimaricola sp.]|uniref:hypothetical protein n=1 Tax=Limimaricola sp. TaxID=2211665 RepID=UPI004059EB80